MISLLRMSVQSLVSLIVFTLLSFTMSAADYNFELSGLTTDNNAPLSNVKVTVYEGSIFMTQYSTSNNGKFSFSLEFNKNFKIILEKDGYISENVSVNTTLSQGFSEQNMSHNISLKMFTPSTAAPFTFEEPVAKVFFNQVIKGFTNEVNYKKTFQTKIENNPSVHDKLGNAGISAEYKYELSLKRSQPKKKEVKEDPKAETKKEEKEEETATSSKNENLALTTAKTEEKEEKKTVSAEKEIAKTETKTAIKKEAVAINKEEIYVVNEEKTTAIQKEKKYITKEEPKVEVKEKKYVAKEEPIAEVKEKKNVTKEEPIVETKEKKYVVKEEQAAVVNKEKKYVAKEEQKKVAFYEPEKKEEKVAGKEVIVERTRKINKEVIELNGRMIEYTQIIYANGGSYYFKNGQSISAETYQREIKNLHK